MPTCRTKAGAAPRRVAVTARDVMDVMGDLDDMKIAAIVAEQPTMDELEEAAAWAAGESDVLGEMERPLEGVTARVYDIITSDRELDEDRD
ncbi:MAG TPA: hypothetical protein VGB90_11575 [Alphaproteobacteria bacterium]|jgi:hypothetical protein